MGTIDITFEEYSPVRGMNKISEILQLIKGYGYIAGGYARYTISPQDDPAGAEDIDIFARSTEAFTYLKEALKTIGLELDKENDLALTFKSTKYSSVQLIKPFRTNAVADRLQDILLHFDFTVTMVGITDNGTVLAYLSFMEDEKNKQLKLLNIHCPVSSIRRFCKYAKKGYKFTMQEAAKLFVDYDKRSPEFKEKIHKLATFVPGRITTPEQSQEIKDLYLEMFID